MFFFASWICFSTIAFCKIAYFILSHMVLQHTVYTAIDLCRLPFIDALYFHRLPFIDAPYFHFFGALEVCSSIGKPFLCKNGRHS